MSNMHAHEMHQLIRSWLLAEDPYGLNNRIEPTMGTPQPGAPASGGAGSAPSAPAPDPRAATAGPQAVSDQLFGEQGLKGADAYRNERAQAWGEDAVKRSTTPSRYNEGEANAAYPDRASTQGEAAVDKELNPPFGTGAGFWAPGEAADMADAVGKNAVAGALAKKARGKIARGRLKDPDDPDDRQPE